MEIATFEDIFKEIKQNLWLLGVPYDDFKFKYRYLILLSSLCSIILAEFLFMVSKRTADNFLEMTHLAPCTFIGILTVLKAAAISTKRKAIYKLTENLKKLYTEVESENEKKALLQKNVTYLIRFKKYYFILNWALISVYNFSPAIVIIMSYLMTGELEFDLPYAVLLPFEIDGWISWSVVYIFSCVCGFTCTLWFTTVDVLYYVLTSQISGNFNIISSKFKKLSVHDTTILKEIVKDHQYILKLADDLEDIYTAPNLFNVLVGSLIICALGFNITTGDLEQMPGYILFLVSVLLQILMMSVFGENIITESLNIGQAAYACEWYEMDTFTKKSILLILTRSAKPQKLTAYKFSVISYESFCKIISNSWTYFTILQTVYAPTVDKL